MKSIFDEPGRSALVKYRVHHGGIELFRAYVERREADRQWNASRLEELQAQLNDPNGLPPQRFDEITTEILRMGILDDLDPIIQDLLKFCESPGPVDDQLPNIRSALRIGKGTAPYDSVLAEKRWKVEQGWINAYSEMEQSKVFCSENTIANSIAEKCCVSKSTAINHWRDLKNREPWQGEWAKQISGMAKIAKARSDQRNKVAPKEAKQKRRITFGKGRANQ